MILFAKILVGVLALAGIAIVVARVVFALPDTAGRVDSTVLPQSTRGPLADALSGRGAAQSRAECKPDAGVRPIE